MLLKSGRGTVPSHGVHRSAALRVKLCIGESKLIASRFCRWGRAALLRGASNKPSAQAKSSCPAGSPAKRSLRLVSPTPTLRLSQRLPPRQQRQRLTQVYESVGTATEKSVTAASNPSHTSVQ